VAQTPNLGDIDRGHISALDTTDTPEPTGSSGSGPLLSQDEIDLALMGAEQLDKAARKVKTSPSTVASELNPPVDEAVNAVSADLDTANSAAKLSASPSLLSQEEIDAVLGRGSGSPAASKQEAGTIGEADFVQQTQLDTLLAEFLKAKAAPKEIAAQSPLPESNAITTAITDGASHASQLSQDDINALMSGSAIPAAKSAPEAEKAEQNDLIDQEQLNALLDAFEKNREAQSKRATEPSPRSVESDFSQQAVPSSPTTPPSSEPMLLSQIELDALINGAIAGSEVPSPEQNLELDAQEQLDAAPAAHIQQQPAPDVVGKSSASDMQEPTPGEVDELISQSMAASPAQNLDAPAGDDFVTPEELEQAVAAFRAQAQTATTVPPPISPPVEQAAVSDEQFAALLSEVPQSKVAPEDDFISQDILQQLLAQSASAASAVSTDTASSEQLAQDDIEALLKSISETPTPAPSMASPAQTQSAPQTTAPTPPPTPKAHVNEDSIGASMDDSLATADPEAPILPNAGPDEILLGKQAAASTMDDVLVPEQDSAKTPAHKPEKVAGEDRISGENIAAAATSDDILSEALLENIISDAQFAAQAADAKEAPKTQTPVSTAKSPEAEVPRDEFAPIEREKKPGPKPRRAIPSKALTSLAAALLGTFAVFGYMQSHRVGVPDIPDPQPLSEIQSASAETALIRSQSAPTTGTDQHAASNTHAGESHPIRPGNERFTTELLRIQNKYKALSELPAPEETEALHAAVNTWVDANQDDPRAASALMIKAGLYEREKLPFGALRVYERVIREYKNAPERDRAMYMAAQTCATLKRFSDAVGYYEMLAQEYPGSDLAVKAKIELADAKRDAGQIREAETMYQQLARVYYGQQIGSDAFGRLGKIEYDRGNFDASITYLNRRLQTATSSEGNDAVHLMLAKAYHKKGEFNHARAILQDLIDFFPSSPHLPEAFVDLSQALDDLGQREDALRVTQQAAASFPKNIAVIEALADMYKRDGQYDASAEAYLAAVKNGGDAPRLLLLAAEQYQAIDRVQESLDTYNKIIDKHGDSPEAVAAAIESAKLLKEAFGKPREALTRLENTAQKTSNRTQRLPILIALAETYHDLHLNERAAAIFEEVTRLSQEPDTQAKAALAMLRAGRTSEGLAMAERVKLDQLPSDRAYALLIAQGRILLNSEPEKALALLEQAHENYGATRTAEGEEGLLDAYLRQNLSQKARKLVTDLQARLPSNPAAVGLFASTARHWADFLFKRGDFSAATDAYTMLLETEGVDPGTVLWARYQKANALFESGEFRASALLFDEVAAAKNHLSAEAQSKALYARLQLERRGETMPLPTAKS
jgi:tetratricopeptide (TPR) repeat protein